MHILFRLFFLHIILNNHPKYIWLFWFIISKEMLHSRSIYWTKGSGDTINTCLFAHFIWNSGENVIDVKGGQVEGS